jgi:hypothetical protein
VREAQERIDSREFAEWMAFDQIDPVGDERTDLMLAQLAALFFNANRDSGTSARSPADFMPFTEKTKDDRQDPDLMLRFFKSMAGVKFG